MYTGGGSITAWGK